jgi:hypothetical protein
MTSLGNKAPQELMILLLEFSPIFLHAASIPKISSICVTPLILSRDSKHCQTPR